MDIISLQENEDGQKRSIQKMTVASNYTTSVTQKITKNILWPVTVYTRYKRGKELAQQARVASFYKERGLLTTFDVPKIEVGLGGIIAAGLYVLAVFIMVFPFFGVVYMPRLFEWMAQFGISFINFLGVSMLVNIVLLSASYYLSSKYKDVQRFALASYDMSLNTIPMYSVLLVVGLFVMFVV